MSYQALYNKYRPTTFEEVAGQGAIVRTLRNALNSQRISHAYLFCGPRGTGKTSMARLFAKALNCDEGIGHQCNHCENCLQLNSSSHPDVIEIDAASNNGVDQVRDLIEKVKYAPIKGRYKIYIIDEVHMMSSGAFNALLKTLEEPPAHVIFILATTEPYKVLPTILSRCQRYDFAKVSDDDIKAKLSWILNKEGISYEEKALDAIVMMADGGMRDALSILDQALAYSGNSLLEKDILSVFGLTSTAEKIRLMQKIAKNEVLDVLSILNNYIELGIDLKRLIASILDFSKDLLIYLTTKTPALLDTLSEKEVTELTGYINVKQANEIIKILLDRQNEFKSVASIKSLFELTLIQLCNIFSDGQSIEIKEEKVEPVVIKQPEIVVEKPKIEPQIIKEPEVAVEEKKAEPTIVEAKFEVPAEPVETKEEIVKPVEEKKEEKPEVVVEEKVEEKEDYYNPLTDGIYKGNTPPQFLFADEEGKEEEITATPAEEVKEETVVTPIVKEETEVVPEIKEEVIVAPTEPEIVKEVEVPQPENIEITTPEPNIMVNISNEEKLTIVEEGTPNVLDDDTIISIMTLGKAFKEKRLELKKNWTYFEETKLDPIVGEVSSLLASGTPFCLCEDVLLVNFNFTNLKKKANLKENQKNISKIISRLVGKDIFVYALDRIDSSRTQNKFYQLSQIGKLPAKNSIVLNLPSKED